MQSVANANNKYSYTANKYIKLFSEVDGMFKEAKTLLKEKQCSLDSSMTSVTETGINSSQEAFEIWNKAFGPIDRPKTGRDGFKLVAKKVLWIKLS